MLWNKLSGSLTLRPELTYVGGTGVSSLSNRYPSYSLTSLTGGVSSAPSAGDIVVCAVGFNNITDRNIQCTSDGYTEVADMSESGSYYPQMGVYYKVLSSVETSVVFDLGVAVASAFCCHVWRGVNVTPIDVSPTTRTSTSTSQILTPPITTASPNAVVVVVGTLGAGSWGSNNTSLENAFNADSGSGFIAICSKKIDTPSTYTPPAFNSSGSFTGNTSVACSVAIRPG